MLGRISYLLWRSRPRWLYGLLAFVTAIAINLSYPQPSYGFSWLELLLQGVQVIQLSHLSDRQEVRLGAEIDRQLLRQGKIRPLKNPQLQQYIGAIGQRLVQASDRPQIPYNFRVLEERSVNAFATMGGFVYLNSGLLLAAANEAELASVMGHEIGHIAGRHAVNQMRDVALSQGLLSAAGLRESTLVQLGVQLAINLPNSREAELAADRMGLEALEGAGYAPIAILGFLEKLLEPGKAPPSFLSTHPATSERLAALERAIDPATAYLGDGLDGEAYQARIRSLLARGSY